MAVKNSPADVLEKLPKNTPVWAVGAVSIIVSFSVSLLAFYFVASSNITTVIEGMIQNKTSVIEATVNERDKTVSAILALVDNNSKQITDLSKALAEAQTSSRSLTERVNVIERELAVAKASLEACEDKLKNCK